jgi:hypothetical protein
LGLDEEAGGEPVERVEPGIKAPEQGPEVGGDGGPDPVRY